MCAFITIENYCSFLLEHVLFLHFKLTLYSTIKAPRRSVKHRRGTLLLPGQPHTNTRGRGGVIRRCNVRFNCLQLEAS